MECWNGGSGNYGDNGLQEIDLGQACKLAELTEHISCHDKIEKKRLKKNDIPCVTFGTWISLISFQNSSAFSLITSVGDFHSALFFTALR